MNPRGPKYFYKNTFTISKLDNSNPMGNLNYTRYTLPVHNTLARHTSIYLSWNLLVFTSAKIGTLLIDAIKTIILGHKTNTETLRILV